MEQARLRCGGGHFTHMHRHRQALTHTYTYTHRAEEGGNGVPRLDDTMWMPILSYKCFLCLPFSLSSMVNGWPKYQIGSQSHKWINEMNVWCLRCFSYRPRWTRAAKVELQWAGSMFEKRQKFWVCSLFGRYTSTNVNFWKKCVYTLCIHERDSSVWKMC